MYEKFYGFKERPFTLLPDPEFLYLSSKHKLARAYLEYGLTQKLGFVVLTGEIGTGKTTLIKSLLQTREGQHRIGVLYQTSFAAKDLLELLLQEFEIHGHYPTRVARLAAFNHFLLQAYSQGEHVVLIVDEAQNLGPAALEELRLLSNIQSDKEPLLQVILVGQPNLRDRLRHPSLRQLAQRVGVHYHLQPLDEDETEEYIRFRLARAGGRGIFTSSALKMIFEYTHGIPRRINTWCDLALVAGFAEGRQEIDQELLRTVMVAQGEALEGPESVPTGQEDAPHTSEWRQELWEQWEQVQKDSEYALGKEELTHFNNEALEKEVMEMSARLARLEGLVLEMTSQLMPALAKILSESWLDTKPILLDHQKAHSPNNIQEPVDEETSPPTSRKWWSRFSKLLWSSSL